ncbi:MAG: PAS domain-containing protein, partial [Methanolobus sp.]|nr:PAS domain-containing protein [Methanolobus sp.]
MKDGFKMLGINDKLKNEIISVINAVSTGDSSVRMSPKSGSLDARVVESVNGVLDNYLRLENELAERKRQDNENIRTELRNKELTTEVLKLVNSAIEGQLDSRASLDGFEGEAKNLLEGINSLLDALINPLTVSAEYIDRISKGEIPEKITDEYKGDFNEIKNNLNMCIDAINDLVDDAVLLAQAGIEGRLDTRADASRHQGDFRKVVEGVNGCLDAVIGPLNVAAEYIERISKGDIPAKISESYNGDFNEIKNNLNICIDSLNALLREAETLTDAAIDGKLTARANADKFSGDYAALVQGMNDVVGTLVGHIGNMPVPCMIIDREYNINYVNGKAAEFAGLDPETMIGTKCFDHYNTNVCRTDNCVCTRSMITRQIEYGEAVSHIGDENIYASCSGVPLKDRSGGVIGSLEVFVDQTEVKTAMEDARSKVELLNNIPTPVMAVEKDFSIMFMNPAGAAAVGKTVEGCMGKKCYELFNTPHCKTEDCQVAKAMQTGKVCSGDTTASLPSGELPIRYTGTALKDAAGNIVGGLEYVQDITTEVTVTAEIVKLTDAAINGRLDARADESLFYGNCLEIATGVNKTLDAFIGPLNVAAEYIDRISKGEIPEMITDDYKGDFNEIKNNLNHCITGLGSLTECNMILQNIAVNDFTVKASNNYRGIFSELAEKANEVLEHLVVVQTTAQQVAEGDLQMLAVYKRIGQRSENDQFMPAFIKMMENIEGLVTAFVELGEATSAGKLDHRADSSRFEGKYYDASFTANAAS